MFPQIEINIEDIPQLATSTDIQLGKVYKFDFATGQYIFKDGKLVELSQLEAVQQWLRLLLITTVDVYKVYQNTGFGTSTNNIIGRKKLPAGFLESEVKREIEEKILLNRAIGGLVSFETTRLTYCLEIKLIFELADGTISEVNQVV